jgi:hypothetical protein
MADMLEKLKSEEKGEAESGESAELEASTEQ